MRGRRCHLCRLLSMEVRRRNAYHTRDNINPYPHIAHENEDRNLQNAWLVGMPRRNFDDSNSNRDSNVDGTCRHIHFRVEHQHMQNGE